VDTDAIIPGRFLNVSDQHLLAENCFVDLRPEFSKAVRPGDVIVPGTTSVADPQESTLRWPSRRRREHGDRKEFCAYLL